MDLWSSLLLASLPVTHTILCRDIGKIQDFLCFTLRLVSQRYKIRVFLSIKTKKVGMLVILQSALGLGTFPTTHGGAVSAIGQKAELTPSLSRKDQAGTSFCHESGKLHK